MQTVSCPLTGGAARFYCRMPPAEYYISRKTGLIFQHPLPSVPEMAAHAESEYESGGYSGYVAAAPLKYSTFDGRLKLVKKYVNGGRLLDVG